MNVREVLVAVNELVAAGIIDAYAIGGAVGATFHLEPVATLDIDVFVAFRAAPAGALIDLSPIFTYLTDRGATVGGEHVIISGWPVQFLPPTGALVEEALARAVSRDVDGTPTRVFTAEHLAAIALETSEVGSGFICQQRAADDK